MASAEGLDAVLVPVGRDVYAVPIGWVREVVMAPQLTSLVTAPASVLGLLNLRGEIVPVLDTASLVGLGRTGESLAFVVVLQTQVGPVGLGATAFPSRTILTDPLGSSELAGTAGTYRVDDAVAVLLDVDALLDSTAVASGEPVDVREQVAGRRA
jgi:purine-binding chemotaxis protein CheW